MPICIKEGCNKEARYKKGNFPGLCINHYFSARYQVNKAQHRSNVKRYTARLFDREKSGEDVQVLKNLREHCAKNNLRYQCEKASITLEIRNKCLELQQNKCAICFKDFLEMKVRPAIDHNHITGKFRGLLCSNCNTALGLLKENQETILNALNYLKTRT